MRTKCNYETNEFWVGYINSIFPNCRQPAHRYCIVNILFSCSEFIIQQNSVQFMSNMLNFCTDGHRIEPQLRQIFKLCNCKYGKDSCVIMFIAIIIIIIITVVIFCQNLFWTDSVHVKFVRHKLKVSCHHSVGN